MFTPDYVVHPWESLKEAMIDRNMTQSELALRTWLTEKTINAIVNGRADITPDSAILLELSLWISAKFWNNLQKDFDEISARLKIEEQFKSEVTLLDQFKNCYSELVKHWILDRVKGKIDKYKQLTHFYAISSLSSVPDTHAVLFRKWISWKIDIQTLSAWIRLWSIDFNTMRLPEFNKQLLKDSLSKLKSLTTQETLPIEDVTKILNKSWVWIVFHPYFSRTYVNWATRWIWWNPYIQLSKRSNAQDTIRFTLFHEIWHVIKHGKKEVFIDYDHSTYEFDPKEKEADDFACNALIPLKSYKKFVKDNDFTNDSIIDFAEITWISSWILAWRLAKDEKISRPRYRHFAKKIAYS